MTPKSAVFDNRPSANSAHSSVNDRDENRANLFRYETNWKSFLACKKRQQNFQNFDAFDSNNRHLFVHRREKNKNYFQISTKEN